MSFLDTVRRAKAYLEEQGRVSLSALKLEFELDEARLESLIEELVDIQQVAAREGKAVSWIGSVHTEPSAQPPRPRTTPAASSEPAVAPQPADAERRHLTVMFCDLVGSTDLSQRLDAEDLRNVVRAYQESASSPIERYAGHIAQYLGDGLLVYFGYPQAHEEDAERAILAGRDVLRGIEMLSARVEAEHGVPISARVGIHTGPVVVGEMGGGEKKEILALGDTPNIAARLEGFAEPGTVVISDATLRLVSGLFVTEDRGTPELKGISEPIGVHKVLQSSGITSRLARASTLTPFVGREQELGLLHDRFEQAQEGQGQAVLVGGEAGIGKSRLLHQLREQLRDAPHSWIQCHTSPYRQNSALYPLIEMLEGVLDFGDEDTSEQKLERLERGLAHAALELATAVPLFASLLSLRLSDRYAPLEIMPQLQRQRTFEMLLAWMLALAEKQPLVLLVEDLHWIDPSTLEWLGLVIGECPTANVLLLMTHRPNFEPPWAGREHLHAITLSRLNRRQSQELVAHSVAKAALPAELVDRIAARSDGVPLFVEELSKGIIETGSAYSHDIPETLHDSLMGRLDRLGDAKQVAQLGAALGREFPYALLEAVAPLEEAALREGLGRLVEAELAYQRGVPPKSIYTFKHALVQDTAYQSLLRSQRKELHGRIADALEAHFPERVAREPEVIARHCEQAGRIEEAIAHYQRAGEQGTQRFAYAEAAGHLKRAIAMLRTLPESPERDRQELLLQSRLGAAMAKLQLSGPETDQALLRTRHLSEQLGDEPELFRSLSGLNDLHRGMGEGAKAGEVAEEMLRLARATQDPKQLIVAHWVMVQTSTARGELLRAREHAEEGIRLYDPQDYRSSEYPYTLCDPGVFLLGGSSNILWQLGYPDQALARSLQAQALARERSDPATQAQVSLFAPSVHLERGEYRAALDLAESMMALAREHGLQFHLVHAAFMRAQALARLGQAAEGWAGLRAAQSETIANPTPRAVPMVVNSAARALGEAGRADVGLDILAEAEVLMESTGTRTGEAELYDIRGNLLLALPTPDPAQAEVAFRKALEVARRQSAKSYELCAAMSLARLWQGQGRNEEARDLLQPVYGWFTEGFDTKDLKDAKALLDGLAQAPRSTTSDNTSPHDS
jgi:class 3 adenylate cyclase/tetratricopeptide (TPR) repeat protein